MSRKNSHFDKFNEEKLRCKFNVTFETFDDAPRSQLIFETFNYLLPETKKTLKPEKELTLVIISNSKTKYEYVHFLAFFNSIWVLKDLKKETSKEPLHKVHQKIVKELIGPEILCVCIIIAIFLSVNYCV